MKKIENEIVGQEMNRRLMLWKKINDFQNYQGNLVDKEYLATNRIVVGERGINRDKKNTQIISSDSYGVTVAIRHTPGKYGGKYPNKLYEDSLLYHYPETKQPSHDLGDINATKTCMKLKLPIFIVITDEETKTKKVKLGWVMDFDDREKMFLIEFGEEKPSLYVNLDEEKPFKLKDANKGKKYLTTSRPNQGEFRYALIKNYGLKCAVCSIEVPELLHASHICEKNESGSDDWRNGILFCHNHHAAFDKNFLRIDPSNLKITSDLKNLKIEESKLATKTGKQPHTDALKWKWKKRNKKK